MFDELEILHPTQIDVLSIYKERIIIKILIEKSIIEIHFPQKYKVNFKQRFTAQFWVFKNDL